MKDKNPRKKVGMKEVQCYSCQRLGNYTRYCYLNKDSRDKLKEIF